MYDLRVIVAVVVIPSSIFGHALLNTLRGHSEPGWKYKNKNSTVLSDNHHGNRFFFHLY